MYNLYGSHYHYANIQRITNHVKMPSDLISNYNHFLSNESIFNANVNWTTPFITNFENVKKFSLYYYKSKQQYFTNNPVMLDKLIDAGYFAKLFANLSVINPDLFNMANVLIKIIIINQLKKYTNGTTEDALGISNIDYQMHFVGEDFFELILHQVTHMLIFIDDRLNSHVPLQWKNFMIPCDLKHKAGGNQFSLYVLYHSYLVGIEVLLYRWQMNNLNFIGNYHGRTESIIRKCLIGKETLDKYNDKMTEHGRTIISIASQRLEMVSSLIKEKNNVTRLC